MTDFLGRRIMKIQNRLLKLILTSILILMLSACDSKTNQEEAGTNTIQNLTEDTSADAAVVTDRAIASANGGTNASNGGTSSGTGNTTDSSNDSSTGSSDDNTTTGTNDDNSTSGSDDNTTSTPPILTLNGEIELTLELGTAYTELGATATDERDGDVNVTIVGEVDSSTIGIYTITYTARDKAGNEASIARTVNVVLAPDVTAPVITLNGDANITLTEGDVYEELGASATDNVDGSVSVSISGNVDTSTVGIYTMTYSAKDKAGNEASMIRTVNVKAKTNNIKTLTLTASQTNIVRVKFAGEYRVAVVEAKVMATYEDGNIQEVTDRVTWQGMSAKMRLTDGKIIFYDENNITLHATYQGIQSNPLSIAVQNAENTASYLHATIYNQMSRMFPQRGAGIEVRLLKEPKAGVKLTVRLKSSDNVGFEDSNTLTKTLHFKTGEGWDRPQAVTIIDKDVNNTQAYTLYTDVFESNDNTYDGIDPKDIVLTPHTSIEFIEPPLRKRKGAIRGVRVQMLLYAKSGDVKNEAFKLIDPPKGMSLELPHMHVINEFNDMSRSATSIVWDVPMDAIEGKSYDITVEASDSKGKKGRITFPIKVPKTKPIQTTLINNELTVTDKSSNLYGMKMKGHSGEDISELRLRSVEYGDVWKKRVKKKSPEDVVERTVFVMDNMPEALDVKMPEWMDSFEKRKLFGTTFLQYSEGGILLGDFWDRAYRAGYNYEETKGLVVPSRHSRLNSSKVFILIIKKSQNRNQ